MNMPAPKNGDQAMSTEKQARELSQKARELAKQDSEKAKDLYAQAARHWRQILDECDEQNAYAASQYLTTARKAGWDLVSLQPQADSLAERFHSDGWLQSAYGWWLIDLSGQELQISRYGEVLDRARAVLALLNRARNPESLARSLFYRIRELHRSWEGHPSQEQQAHNLVDLMMTHGLSLLGLLEKVSKQGQPKDRRFKPLSAQFLYMLRKLGLELGRQDLLEAFMGPACEQHPGDEWFAEAWVHAARLKGDLDEAAERGRKAFAQAPASWAVARARAAVEQERGKMEKAIKLMGYACLRNNSVWAWKEMARLQAEDGQTQNAAQSLACGLAVCPKADLPKAWRMYFDRARMLSDLGRQEEAAVDAWLAGRVRAMGGWGANRDLENFCHEQRQAFDPCWDELHLLPGESVLNQHRIWCKAIAKDHQGDQMRPGTITRYDAERGFGFLRLEDGRSLFLHKRVAGRLKLSGGEKVLALAVPGYDRKKAQQSWETASIELA